MTDDRGQIWVAGVRVASYVFWGFTDGIWDGGMKRVAGGYETGAKY